MEVSYQKTEIALLDFELSIVNSSTTVTVFRNGFNKLGTWRKWRFIASRKTFELTEKYSLDNFTSVI